MWIWWYSQKIDNIDQHVCCNNLDQLLWDQLFLKWHLWLCSAWSVGDVETTVCVEASSSRFPFIKPWLNMLYVHSDRCHLEVNIIPTQRYPIRPHRLAEFYWCHIAFTHLAGHDWRVCIYQLCKRPWMYMKNVGSRCLPQARRELWDSRGSVHPQERPLHALPGLQREARHAACQRC